jgi:hypothetical protein
MDRYYILWRNYYHGKHHFGLVAKLDWLLLMHNFLIVIYTVIKMNKSGPTYCQLFRKVTDWKPRQ